MTKLFTFLCCLLATTFYAQINEGQDFCEATKDGDYFPLSLEKKKILWADSSYLETQNGTKEINGKIYIEFLQDWGKQKEKLYLREENGVIYQYDDCCTIETVRYDKNFKKGHSWKTANGKSTYEIISYNGKLKTPFCEYKNLLVIKAELEFGTYHFYYLKGHGYVGATTTKNKLISCVTPIW
jgi:hypothetical protein